MYIFRAFFIQGDAKKKGSPVFKGMKGLKYLGLSENSGCD